jgi:hypothetical protein
MFDEHEHDEDDDDGQVWNGKSFFYWCKFIRLYTYTQYNENSKLIFKFKE